MNIRIIAGKYGGRVVEAPPGNKTHPMSERIRNAMFNSLGVTVQGAVVCDAFAGSGAVGLEALSRGATRATFVEKDRIAQKVIAKNINLLGATTQSELIRTSGSNWLETSAPVEFDIIFADPPYHDTQVPTIRRLADRLASGGYLVLSLPEKHETPTIEGLELISNKIYGNATLVTYQKL